VGQNPKGVLVTTARDEVLARIRGALGDQVLAPAVPRDYRLVGDLAPGDPALVAQLVDRLEDYKATVVRVTDRDDVSIGQAVAGVLAAREISQALVPSGAPAQWAAGLSEPIVDNGTLDARALDLVPAVVTGSVVAVSETGTIALDGGPRCGRRAITLVPDVHVCIVRAEDVVQTVPEGLARLDPTRPLTLVSGPSATSDIELSRVEGVHGPRTLVIIIAG
jgi:L-lactate dehydrogenase complex protein LldG